MSSERFTSGHLPGTDADSGICIEGRVPIADVVDIIRQRARRAKADAEEILAAAATDFRVETFRGVWVKKNKEILQVGRK